MGAGWSGMGRAGLIALASLALLLAALGMAVIALFTTPAFEALGFHRIALHYFQGAMDETMLAGVRIGGQSFSPAEIAHFADVKWLLGVVRIACVLAIGVAIAIAFGAPAAFAKATIGAPLVFLIIGGLVVASYFTFGFLAVGVFLHEIVFPQGNYSFPWDSLIIRLYGTEVMVRGTVFVIAAALGLLVAAIPLGWLVRRRIR